MAPKLHDIIELEIERLSYDGGRGVARHDGFVIFVPMVAPGDRISVKITEVKSNFAIASVEKILKPASSRVAPHCSVFGKCGGCRWQHVDYDEQVRQKAQLIEFNLKKIYPEKIEVIGSPKSYRYRNRIQLHKKGNQVGYYAESSHDLVPISDCPIADDDLTPLIQRLATDASYAEGKYELALTESEPVLRYLQNEASEFTQVNNAQNDKMKELVFTYLEGKHYSLIYDLYCGAGNFTFPLAYFYKQTPIWGIEASLSAIQRAESRASIAGLSRLQFRAQGVKDFLKRQHPKADTLVLADPPRAGLENEVVKELLRLEPRTIVYIGCHLTTLTRDLQKLSCDYKVDQVIGVDMFPQTEYVETLSFLSHR